MANEDPTVPGITPWSQLEGPAIARSIARAEARGDEDTAEELREIDRNARDLTGDEPPEY
jgi:hypothetical protein